MNKKIIVNFIGLLVVVASFYFVFTVLWENWTLIVKWKPSSSSIALFFLCAIIYGMSQFSLSGAWIQLLNLSGERDVDPRVCHKLYGETQIAKYIPGNIFHFAGRHIRGRESGYSHVALAGATLYESLGLIIVACALSTTGILVLAIDQDIFSHEYLFAVFMLSIVVFLAAVVLFSRYAKSKNPELIVKGLRSIIKPLIKVTLLYGVFFLLSGSLLALVVISQVHDLSLENIGIIIVVYVFSWIVGFVAPGAPAGVGVREAILVISLTQLFGGSLAVITALIYRLITAAGDIIFYLGARTINLHKQT